MTTPTDPAARALQRVRDRHAPCPDGTCLECGVPWPCSTINDLDGDPPDDPVATALNKLRTTMAALEAEPPSSEGALRQAVLDILPAEPQPEPAPEAPADPEAEPTP